MLKTQILVWLGLSGYIRFVILVTLFQGLNLDPSQVVRYEFCKNDKKFGIQFCPLKYQRFFLRKDDRDTGEGKKAEKKKRKTFILVFKGQSQHLKGMFG